jgi:hypothetical protein
MKEAGAHLEEAGLFGVVVLMGASPALLGTAAGDGKIILFS